MPEPSQSVKGFVIDSYQLISASSPTVPLQGDDVLKGVQFLNELMAAYSSSGLMLTIAQQVDFPLSIGEGEITFADATYTPAATVQIGRLANLENAWVNLEGVDYPLIDESRHDFFSAYKYFPLQGLPRYIIVKPQTNVTTVQIFPAPSQYYQMFVYGKFQFSLYTENSDMSNLPTYYIQYLRFALAKMLSFYKGRTDAWTDKLEMALMEFKQDMMSASSYNLDIQVNTESWLNGAYRVRAGI
jgi:hypothetical protein